VNAELSRRPLAEMVGTALLVVFGAGALVAALEVGGGKLDYAGLGLGIVVIAVVVYMFGTTSGAHINPAVTVAPAVVRRFPWPEVGPYILAQLAGAVIGGILVNAIRTFGPYVATSVFGGSPPWGQIWIYVAGPVVGGAIAALVYDAIARPRRAELATVTADRQGTAGEVEGRRVLPAEERGTTGREP
jgi:glycerol uptake facilitator-like aquaporin